MSKILEKKIPLLFILIALSILIYTFYKSEILNEGNLKYYYINDSNMWPAHIIWGNTIWLVGKI